MPYHFVTDRFNYEIFSSGQVFYSQPGYPAFPVRLASEAFQRCLAIRNSRGQDGPVVMYDPCCGGAYHLSVLAYMHWEAIRQLIASDITDEAVLLAKRNLSLLTPHGLDNRIKELFNLLQQYGKPSHQEALENAETLKRAVLGKPHIIETSVFQANALKANEIASHVSAQSVDVVFTDIPYGQQSYWQGIDAGLNEIDAARGPVWAMLNTVLPLLAPGGLVIVASDKQQKASHEGYKRVEQFKVGKRQLVILEAGKSR